MKIAEARRARKLSQRQLAERAGVPQPMIARLERPTNQSVTVRTLAAVATALGYRLQIGLSHKRARKGTSRPVRAKAA